jgi:hypothetical protein
MDRFLSTMDLEFTDQRPESVQPMATALSQVDFFVYAYYARSIVVVDVPFQASQDWIDLVPGLSVQIDGAEYEEEANRWRFHKGHPLN